jgi:general secretion pathway protein G
MHRQVKGFTLIELLVVITIISLLVLIGVAIYSTTGAKARDARRKEDLQAIAQALEIYFQKNETYPITSDWVKSSNPAPWIPGLTNEYIETIPRDPKANGGTPWEPANNDGFEYGYWAASTTSFGSQCPGTSGQYFILLAQLENKDDSDRMEIKNPKWCNGQGLYSNYNYPPYSFAITSIE